MLTLRKEYFINWPRPEPEEYRNAEQKAPDDIPVQGAIGFHHQALKALSERTYWTRVWVVQEIALPTNVVILCGHKRLSFSLFTAGFLFLALKGGVVSRTVIAADLSDTVRGAASEMLISTAFEPEPVRKNTETQCRRLS
jgi:hypothetical protein